MEDRTYASKVFNEHVSRSGLNSLQGLKVLELGPGYSLLTAEYALEAGAAYVWLIDAGRFASSGGLPDRASYLTSGLQSLRSLPDSSVDFIFSQAVLEHIRLGELQATFDELRRICSPHAVSSHVIDFKDHLQYSLNNLRFSEKTWESRLMAGSGFYTNRVPFPRMMEIFKKSGFSLSCGNPKRWPNGLPLKQSRMAEPFASMPPEDLMVMEADVVFLPA